MIDKGETLEQNLFLPTKSSRVITSTKDYVSLRKYNNHLDVDSLERS